MPEEVGEEEEKMRCQYKAYRRELALEDEKNKQCITLGGRNRQYEHDPAPLPVVE